MNTIHKTTQCRVFRLVLAMAALTAVAAVDAQTPQSKRSTPSKRSSTSVRSTNVKKPAETPQVAPRPAAEPAKVRPKDQVDGIVPITHAEMKQFTDKLLAFAADLDAGKVPLELEPITVADLMFMRDPSTMGQDRKTNFYPPDQMVEIVKRAAIADKIGLDTCTARYGLLETVPEKKSAWEERIDQGVKLMVQDFLKVKKKWYEDKEKGPVISTGYGVRVVGKYDSWLLRNRDNDKAQVMRYFESVASYMEQQALAAKTPAQEKEIWDRAGVLSALGGKSTGYYIIKYKILEEEWAIVKREQWRLERARKDDEASLTAMLYQQLEPQLSTWAAIRTDRLTNTVPLSASVRAFAPAGYATLDERLAKAAAAVYDPEADAVTEAPEEWLNRQTETPQPQRKLSRLLTREEADAASAGAVSVTTEQAAPQSIGDARGTRTHH